jgi:hypothetical protein
VIELHGADDLARLSRVLKDAGEKDLQRQLTAGIRAAMEPVKEALHRSAEAKLPKRGGLAAGIAGSKMRVTRRNTGRSIGVRLRVENPDNIRRLDRGSVRHPVFGRWLPGVPAQHVPTGWFTEPTEAARPAFAAAVDQAMNDVVKQINARTGS